MTYTLEVDAKTYYHIVDIAEKLEIDVDDMLRDVISDGTLEKFYEADLHSIEQVEADREIARREWEWDMKRGK